MKKFILLILSLFLIETSQAQIVNPNPPGSTNWASPGAIGSITPNSGKFTYLTTNEVITGLLSQGAFSYGTLSYTDINISGSFAGNQNAYFQHIIQNTNAGTAASADYIVSNNLGTASTYYGDFGITSSGYNTSGQNILNQANTVYFQSQSADVAVGTLTANGIHLVTNLIDRMDISATGVLSGPSLTAFMSSPGAIGNVTPSTGAFTTATATTFTGALVGNASTATSATTATTAANIAGGSANSVPYQTGAGATAFVAPGTNGYILQMVSGTPAWANTSGVFNPAAVAITGGQINGTTIGATTPSTGAFTTLSATGGQINGTTIGATTPSTGAFTTLGATTFTSGTGVNGVLAEQIVGAGAYALYSTSVTPSATNYSLAFNSTTTLNSPTGGSTNIAVNNSPIITASADTATIKGTVLGGNAAAGQVGEYVTNTASGVSLTSTVIANVTTLTLTAGDWDIWGNSCIIGNAGTTSNEMSSSISSVSASMNALPNVWVVDNLTNTAPAVCAALSPIRASLSSPATYYCVAQSIFSISTMTADCVLNARRVR